MSGKPSVFRRKFVVNPRFQYTLMGALVVIALVGFVCLYYSQHYFFSEFDSLADRMGFPSTHTFRIFIEHQKDSLRNLFIYVGIINIIFISLMGLFLSHSIAGPIYRIIRSLDDITNGGDVKKITIRKNDMFQELPEAINKALGVRE